MEHLKSRGICCQTKTALLLICNELQQAPCSVSQKVLITIYSARDIVKSLECSGVQISNAYLQSVRRCQAATPFPGCAKPMAGRNRSPSRRQVHENIKNLPPPHIDPTAPSNPSTSRNLDLYYLYERPIGYIAYEVVTWLINLQQPTWHCWHLSPSGSIHPM